MLEVCIEEHLYNYFVKSGLLCKKTFCVPGLNTSKDLDTVVDNVLEKKLEHKLICSATIIDLTKAFGSISHELLIVKLHSKGVKNLESQLLTSYLNGRKQ